MLQTEIKNERTMTPLGAWLLFAAMVMIMFGTSFNTMATLVALTEIRHQLQITLTQQEWVFVGFSICTMGSVLIFGQLAELYSYFWVFIVGLLLFLISSVLCAAAVDGTMLLVGRFIQGLAYGALFPTSLALLKYAPPERYNNLFQVMWVGMQILGYGAGPIVGGALAHGDNWRIIYWINLGFFGFSFLLSWFFYHQVRITRKGGWPDIFGSLFIIGFSAVTVLVVAQGYDWGWFSPQMIVCETLIPVFFVLFILAEWYVKKPLLNLSLFADWDFTIGAFLYFALGAVIYGINYFFNLYAQDNSFLSLTPLVSGLLLMLLGLTSFPFTLLDVPLVKWVGALALISLGCAILLVAFLNFWLGFNMSIEDVWWKLFLAGIGFGFAYSLCSEVGLATMSSNLSGEAASMINFGNYLGATLGVAIVQVIYLQTTQNYFAAARAHLPTVFAGTSLQKMIALSHAPLPAFRAYIGSFPIAAQPIVKGIFHQGLARGFAYGNLYFSIYIMASLGVSVLGWLLIRQTPR